MTKVLPSELFDSIPLSKTLPNGLQVAYHHNGKSDLSSVQIWIKTGSIHEGNLLGSGLSHFLEHMLFKGTARRPENQIAKEVQDLGGNINAYTSFDRTVYYINGPASQTIEFFDILSDMTFRALIPESEFEKEREVILREIDMTQDDPDRTVSRALLSLSFKKYPFRHPVIGHRSLFERITYQDLMAYYKKRYLPNNAVVSISSSIELDEFIAKATSLIEDIPPKPLEPIYIPQEDNQLSFRQLNLYDESHICRGAMAFKIPSMRSPDSPALDVLAAILGSGHSGVLRQKFRNEENLVHSVSASSWAPGDVGLFWIHYQCDVDKKDLAENAISDFLESLSESTIQQSHIEKAKRFAIVGELNSRQTAGGMASKLGLLEAIVGDLNYPKTYFERISKLKVEDILDVIRKYLKPSGLTSVSLNSLEFKPSKPPHSTSNEVEEFKLLELSNGFRIAHQVDRRSPQISLRYTALGGPNFETDSQKGVTSLLSTMLTKDTEYRSEESIDESLESLGGFMQESSGNNTFGVSVDLLSQDYIFGLQTLEEAILSPAFKPETTDREKDNQIASIQETMDEILYFGKRILRQKFFEKHAFAFDPLGTEECLNNISPDILKTFYRRLVVSKNSILTVVGDFDPDRLIPRLEAMGQQFHQTHFENREAEFHAPMNPGEFIEHMPKDQAVVFDGFPDCGLSHQDYLAGEIIDEVLSSMSGPLFSNVREKNSLAYYVGSNRTLSRQFGMFALYAGTQEKSVAAVQDAFDKEILKIRTEGMDEPTIKSAIKKLLTRKASSLQTLSNRATEASLNLLYGKPVDHWKSYQMALESIRPEIIRLFAIKHLDPAKRIRLVVKPSDLK